VIQPKTNIFRKKTEYYRGGVRHREDGPALIYDEGMVREDGDYFLEGEMLSEVEWKWKVNLKKVLE